VITLTLPLAASGAEVGAAGALGTGLAAAGEVVAAEQAARKLAPSAPMPAAATPCTASLRASRRLIGRVNGERGRGSMVLSTSSTSST
jgi:hypothetical protein